VGISTSRLSHARALAFALSQDKQLELAHAKVYYLPIQPQQQVWKGYNTPNADVPVAYLLRLNVRDSCVEDNVRKRPLPKKLDPLTLSDFPSRLQR